MTPDVHTIKEHFIDVGDGHTLYVHDWGNPDATPIFFLHGGPGSSSKDGRKNLFDPSKQRVIFHDQRGCGRSTPYGSRDNNTTQHLIADISKIADTLEIQQFILNGMSWGSTLALTYAIENPHRVAAIVTGGVFLAMRSDIDWIDNGDVKTFYPELWQELLDSTPESERQHSVAYHQKRALFGTAEAQKESSFVYGRFEYGMGTLDDRPAQLDYETYDPASAQIEIHYLQNNCFIPEGYILDNAAKLTMPIYIIQGRYDMVCPPISAYSLHQKLENSELYFTLEGHIPGHEGWNLTRSLLKRVTRK